MSDSRAALLAAAAEEFAMRGLDGTRVQAIVARSGVNERMIYHHFGNKQGLYRAVLELEVARLNDRLAAAQAEIDAAESVYHATRRILIAMTDHFVSRPVMAGLWFHEATTGATWLRQITEPGRYPPAPMRALYERGQREGVFRTDVGPETFHVTAMSAIVGLAVLAPLAELAAVESRPEFIEQFVGQLLDGMTGPS